MERRDGDGITSSLESRDNPFLPGGDLSKEAEDLLSKATIIRDNFYLNEEERRELKQQQEQEAVELQQLHQEQTQKPGRGVIKHVQILDHHDGRIYRSTDPSSPPHNGGVEERISPLTSSNTFAAPVPSSPTQTSPDGGGGSPNHKEANGKSSNDHTGNNASSPDNVKIAIPEGGEGQSIPLTGDSDKKRRNKCCSVM